MSRVLIVEDEERERKTLSRVLELEGFTVDAAATADQALATLAGEHFDVALIDVMMPGLSGIALARMIANRHADVALVLISAFHLSSRQLERLDIPRVHFVDKPLEMPALLTLLRSLPTDAS